MALLEQIGVGIVAGIVMGLTGYFGRDFDEDEGVFEDFQPAKFGRTIVIYAAAGAVVGYAGDPLTQGNITAATGSTVVLGELAERLIKRAQKQRRANLRRA